MEGRTAEVLAVGVRLLRRAERERERERDDAEDEEERSWWWNMVCRDSFILRADMATTESKLLLLLSVKA